MNKKNHKKQNKTISSHHAAVTLKDDCQSLTIGSQMKSREVYPTTSTSDNNHKLAVRSR